MQDEPYDEKRRKSKGEAPVVNGRRAPYRRTIAPRVVEQHARGCALSSGGRRCTCRPRYRARAVRDGRQLARSFAERADALAWADQAAEALRQGAAPPASPEVSLPLHDLAVSFLHRAGRGEALTRAGRRYGAKTVELYETELRLHVLPVLGELPAGAVDARAVQRMVDDVAASVGPAVARDSAAALTAVLRDGYRRGLVDTLPPRVLRPAPPPARSRVLTEDESARLAVCAEADDQARRRSLLGPLVCLLEAGGLRIGEALGLVWGSDGLDLDAEEPRARIGRSSTKTDAGARDVYLGARTATVLRRHYLASGRPEPGTPVFADEQGRPLSRDGARVYRGLQRAARAAGVEPFSPHVLRHTHATRLAAAGVPPALAAQRLGHADGGGFFLARYSHPGPAEARILLGLLEQLDGRPERMQAIT